MTQEPSRWKRGYAYVNEKVFRQMDKVGVKVNATAEKFGLEPFWPTNMTQEIEKCARILRAFTGEQILETVENGPQRKKQKILVKIPPKLIRDAQGLAIYTCSRTGLGVSAASGGGVVIAKDAQGNWGPPSGILIHTVGFGFIAGIDFYDVVLILRTRKAVAAFANPKISIGAELAVTAGPLGTGATLTTGLEAAPVLSYTKSKGLYGGAQIDGNIIIERVDENARFYGRSIKAKEILDENSKVEVPAGSEPLHIAIAQATLPKYMRPASTPALSTSSSASGSRVTGGGWIDEKDDAGSRPKSTQTISAFSGTSAVKLENGLVADQESGQFLWQDAYESGERNPRDVYHILATPSPSTSKSPHTSSSLYSPTSTSFEHSRHSSIATSVTRTSDLHDLPGRMTTIDLNDDSKLESQSAPAKTLSFEDAYPQPSSYYTPPPPKTEFESPPPPLYSPPSSPPPPPTNLTRASTSATRNGPTRFVAPPPPRRSMPPPPRAAAATPTLPDIPPRRSTPVPRRSMSKSPVPKENSRSPSPIAINGIIAQSNGDNVEEKTLVDEAVSHEKEKVDEKEDESRHITSSTLP